MHAVRRRVRHVPPAVQAANLAAELRQMALSPWIDRANLLALADWADIIAARLPMGAAR